MISTAGRQSQPWQEEQQQHQWIQQPEWLRRQQQWQSKRIRRQQQWKPSTTSAQSNQAVCKQLLLLDSWMQRQASQPGMFQAIDGARLNRNAR